MTKRRRKPKQLIRIEARYEPSGDYMIHYWYDDGEIKRLCDSTVWVEADDDYYFDPRDFDFCKDCTAIYVDDILHGKQIFDARQTNEHAALERG